MNTIATVAESTAAGKEALRGGIELQYNTARDTIEKTFISDRNVREKQYHADLKANRLAKEAAMRAAGLNSDGSSRYGRPTG